MNLVAISSGDAQLDVQFPDHHNALNQTDIPLLQSPTSDELHNFRISLKWCALDHSSLTGKLVSYITFTTLTIIIPILISFSVAFTTSEASISFNKLVQIPESGLSAISFFTLSTFFHKYNHRQLLLADGLKDDPLSVRQGYKRELDKSFRCLAWILLPSFCVELVHEIVLLVTMKISIPYISSGILSNSIVFVFVLASWVYRTGVFLLVCGLFRLTCELQILRFEGLHKVFEGCGSESDCGVIFEEHLRIKKQLSLASHRYRFFIIGCLILITVSQLGALLMVLASKSDKNFLNSGDIVVCSAVQLSGFLLCLLGAARITHRAQGIVSIATRWHMLATCPLAASSDHGRPNGTLISNGIDSDDSHSSHMFITTSSSLGQSSCQTRQALVTYLQHNNGGITLFGFALDRGLLHTIFAFEFSLVLWILSKVVVLS